MIPSISTAPVPHFPGSFLGRKVEQLGRIRIILPRHANAMWMGWHKRPILWQAIAFWAIRQQDYVPGSSFSSILSVRIMTWEGPTSPNMPAPTMWTRSQPKKDSRFKRKPSGSADLWDRIVPDLFFFLGREIQVSAVERNFAMFVAGDWNNHGIPRQIQGFGDINSPNTTSAAGKFPGCRLLVMGSHGPFCWLVEHNGPWYQRRRFKFPGPHSLAAEQWAGLSSTRHFVNILFWWTGMGWHKTKQTSSPVILAIWNFASWLFLRVDRCCQTPQLFQRKEHPEHEQAQIPLLRGFGETPLLFFSKGKKRNGRALSYLS